MQRLNHIVSRLYDSSQFAGVGDENSPNFDFHRTIPLENFTTIQQHATN